VVEHGGTAVVAAIAPFEHAREEARQLVEKHGRFLLVHVATPLQVAEQRDVKGSTPRRGPARSPSSPASATPTRCPAAPS
jgi:adenylylsulfate kinase-like enzyme